MSELNELFARDPLQLSDQDVDAIIAGLREMRILQQQEDAKSRKSGKRRKGVAALPPVSQEEMKKISVDDILGGLL